MSMRIRPTVLWAAATVALALAASPRRADACRCMPRSPDVLRQDADLVFEGEIIKIAPADPKELLPPDVDPSYYTQRATFRIEKVIKGEAHGVIVLAYSEDTARCGLGDLQRGSRYLVYAKRKDGLITSSLCSGTEKLQGPPPVPPPGPAPAPAPAPVPPPHGGCAHCGAGEPTGAAPLILAVAAAVLLRPRRRARAAG